MSSNDLPAPVRRLLIDCIASAAELETLLLLHAEPSRAWSAADVDSRLRIGEAPAAGALRTLTDAGLATAEGAAFRFGPRDEQRRLAVGQLAESYARRRVRVIEFLYNKPSDRISLFSDAFRFRRDERD